MLRKLTLKEIQDETYGILLYFDGLCRKWGLKYYLAYGTLIGAVRHGDFIPWDDDLDVWMPRKDFDRFRALCRVCREDLLPYRLCERSNTRHYPYGIPRLTDLRKRFAFAEEGHPTPRMGTFIDVYPLDNFGNTDEDAAWLLGINERINAAYCAYVDGKSFSSEEETGFSKKKLVHLLTRAAFGANWHKWVDKLILAVVKCRTSDGDEYIGLPTWTDARMRREWFSGTAELPFRDRTFPVPSGYDEILRSIYGDYMQLPPEEERQPYHQYDIYRKDRG